MKWTIQLGLRLYKRWISPMLPHSCRFVPTCSEYAMEAVERHGALRGSALALGRLLRCHPFAHAGYDPVPGVRRSVPQVRVRILDANLGRVEDPRLAQRMGEPGAPVHSSW